MNSTKKIIRIGLLSALVFVAQVSLSVIPNVELVSVLLMSYTLVFGFFEAIVISLIFVTTQWILYGIHTWVLLYYLAWPLLVYLTYLLHKKTKNIDLFALMAGGFGFCFGLMDALINGLFYGATAIISVWIRGLPFDIIHGLSNYITVLILLEPLTQVLKKLHTK